MNNRHLLNREVRHDGTYGRIILFLATVGGIGYLPIGRGTAVMVPFLFLLPSFTALSPAVRVGIAAIAIFVAVVIAQSAEAVFGVHDDHRIVIDEAVSLFVTFASIPAIGIFSPFLVLGFLLNRVLDWTKPFPVSRIQHLSGGWGIVMDDVASGAMAGAILHVTMTLFG